MNVHHLELFYYVAQHGGIMEAVRKMPYGIQQPAISGQILQLEADLGVKLFHRRPFKLTASGEELYHFIYPFFSNVNQFGNHLRGGTSQSLVLAAPVMALRDYLPTVLHSLRHQFPKLKLTLRAGQQPQVWNWLERREVDIAITLLEEQSTLGLHQIPILELPIIFLVPKSSPFRSTKNILEAITNGTLLEPLITLTEGELVPRYFRELLAKNGLDWPPEIEVTDIELIDSYVKNSFGIGLTLDIPGKILPTTIRKIHIDTIPPLRLGVVWRGHPTSVMQALIDSLKSIDKTLKSPISLPS